jgi:hypothetical protein
VEDPTVPGIYLFAGIFILGVILIVYELHPDNNKKE